MAAADPQVRIEMLEAALRTASRELHWANLTIQKKDAEIQLLQERLRKQRIGFLGPSSETLSDLQLELLTEEEPGATREEVEAESRREPIAAGPPRERKPHPGRKPLPESLPRVEQVIACEPNCKHCGGETRVIGYDLSEVLDREPAKWFVRVTKREKRSCGKCAAIQMPPLAPRIVEKGLASDRVIIETVVAKYCDHLPLYRQEAMMEREAGVEISRATLDGWVMRVGELLQPVAGAMREQLLRASYIQADETVVPVQMHDHRGADHPAYLWQYGTPGGETMFDFQLGRGRDGPAKFLKGWNGILQTDGYQAYDQVGGPGLIHVGCWAHARRKFVDAVKVNPKDDAAIAMVTRMDALFLVDRQARQQQLSAEERAALRREHAQAWVDEIHSECRRLRAHLLPKSALGEAVNYTLNMWDKLKRCFDHAEVELSNNIAENSMRPVALGRKNWLHVGSAKAGPKVAAILSIVESCRRLGIPVKDYLLAVLPGLNQRSHSDAAQITPARWKPSQPSRWSTDCS
ncbi:MAG: IS66 family transposase [Acidobacteriia bacterium]|nr:IS66 family transposase [Terriglobia bacterium]